MRVTTPKASKSKPIINLSPLKRTTSPITSSNKSQQKSTKSLSPVKKSPTKQPNQQQLITKMQRNRQRLCNTLDTYTLLIRSNHPLRCLQHNSNISIYCQTQQKLLCSSCIFSKLDHKYHKVVPVDKVHEKLQRDVQIMQRQIQREVQGIEQVYQRIFIHYQQQQQTAQQAMIKVQKLYQDGRIMLDQCEIQSKKKIVIQLQKIQLKHQTLLAELNFLKNVYKDQYAQIQPINDANFLIYQHAMCSTVVNQGKFSHIKWKPPINQIHKIQIDQCRRIVQVLDLLDKYLREKLKPK